VTCTNCLSPHEDWPGKNGLLCQDCWEKESSQMFWNMAVAFDKANLLGDSGTVAWEQQQEEFCPSLGSGEFLKRAQVLIEYDDLHIANPPFAGSGG
jgi:hypothetical protein